MRIISKNFFQLPTEIFRCEYIFYRGLYRTSYLRMSRGKVTDTELQVGQFVLPRYGHGVTDESKEARNIHINKEVLDENHVSIFV